MEAIERNITSLDWVTLLLLFILCGLVLIKTSYPERFYDFSRIAFSNKYFTTHKKSLKVLNFFSFYLYLLKAAILSLGIYIAWRVFNLPAQQDGFTLYLQIFVIYNIVIGGKYLLEKIIANLFSIEKVFDNYLFYKLTFKNLLALVFLPVILLFFYGWQPNKIGIITAIAAFLIFNFFALLSYYKKNQNIVLGHWFYFILYLCTLEIAPYFILYKVFTLAS